MIFLGLTHTLEFFKYYMIYRGVFKAKFTESVLHKFTVFAVSLMLTEFLVYVNFFDQLVVAISCLIGMILVINEKKLKILLMFPFAFFLISSVDVLMSYFLAFIIHMPYKDFYNCNLFVMVVGIPTALFFGMTSWFLGRYKDSKMIRINVPKYFIALLGAMSLFIMVGVSQGIMLGESLAEEMIPFMAFCFSAAAILFYVFIMWQVSIERKANNYQMENELYRSYLEKQEEHINNIIYSDQCMRRFRHDMRAHIAALEAECEEGDIEAIKNYLDRMKKESKKRLVEKYTGIVAVDAIVGEWHQAALEDNISWKWEGELLPQNTADIFDLCIIFSNLLSNAVEAARNVKGERSIRIFCRGFQSYVTIIVANTYEGDLPPARGTTKKDTINHGYGIMNIQEIVNKKEGRYNSKTQDGIYEVEIVI